MRSEIKVPSLGESVTSAQLKWIKKIGEPAKRDEVLVEFESDKATVEAYASGAGSVVEILKQSGEQAATGEVIGYFQEGAVAGGGAPSAAPAPAAQAAPAAPPAAAKPVAAEVSPRVMPAAARLAHENNIPVESVPGSGPGGRVLKEDVMKAVAQPAPAAAPRNDTATAVATLPPPMPTQSMAPATAMLGDRQEEVVPMSPIRRRIAQRLVEAQQTAALLTTFNEVDMTAVMELRNLYKDSFNDKYKIKLGFMSFFVKASIEALKAYPAVNSEIRGTNIVYRNFYDIGIAVGSGKGLVVPILRSAERMSFAEVELTIAELATRAKINKITLEELQGGTFTISNGGVYGSMLSTPIVNPPQSAILGLHAIQDRPVARNGQVVIRPMMYLALTYDHRVIDGREAVSFLKHIKQLIEDPSRMLLEV